MKRLPYKRGFNNIFRVEYAVVNLDRLNDFPDGSEVTPDDMVARGILKGRGKPVKVLGNGDLSRKLVIKAHGFSQAAKTRIEAAGGRAEVLA